MKSLQYITRAIIVLVVIVSITGCAQKNSPSHSEPAIELAVDTVSVSLAEALANTYESMRQGVVITLTPMSRRSILTAINNNQVDAAIVLSPPDEEPALFSTPIGRELLVLIAHPSVPVDNLYRNDVRAIFSGQLSAWNGHATTPIPLTIVVQAQGNSTQQMMERRLMAGQTTVPNSKIATTDTTALEIVSTTPGAIGYVAQSSLNNADVKQLHFENTPPTLAAGRENRYTLTVPTVFTTLEEPRGNVRTFLEWIISEEGQQVVQRYMLGIND